MATYEIVVPRLGEAVIEATITRWLVAEGDHIQEDDPVAEIATDKVDSEITSPVAGKLVRKLAKEGDVVPVGHAIAALETDGTGSGSDLPVEKPFVSDTTGTAQEVNPESEPETAGEVEKDPEQEVAGARFYSPLVRSIAAKENISIDELDSVQGTGKNDRLTKKDLMDYLDTLKAAPVSPAAHPVHPPAIPVSSNDQVVEMDRIRQLIANHMVRSVQTSPHVTSLVEVDMTRIVTWREKNKTAFQQREGDKLTYTPVFIDAIAKAVRDYPLMNVSVDGTRIILRKQINIGMAVALPNSNLIVPVIREADRKSLLGIIKNVSDIANRARLNQLVPDEIAGGTISLTNLGSFGTLMGTPIINQPQCAIIAVGAIKKRPVVVETPEGDTIAIRHMMFLSVTFDHRVIDGALAGKFLNKLVEYLEEFDSHQAI